MFSNMWYFRLAKLVGYVEVKVPLPLSTSSSSSSSDASASYHYQSLAFTLVLFCFTWIYVFLIFFRVVFLFVSLSLCLNVITIRTVKSVSADPLAMQPTFVCSVSQDVSQYVSHARAHAVSRLPYETENCKTILHISKTQQLQSLFPSINNTHPATNALKLTLQMIGQMCVCVCVLPLRKPHVLHTYMYEYVQYCQICMEKTTNNSLSCIIN